MAVDISELDKTATHGQHFQKGSRMSNLSSTTLLQSSSNMHQTLSPRRGRHTSTSTFSSLPPKSKVPKLQYGGLSPPNLHCFATSLLTNPVSPLQEKAVFLEPTPKSLPSPASFRKTFTALQPIRTIPNQKELDPNSGVILTGSNSLPNSCEIHNSEFMDQHIDRIADSLGTGGLVAYIQIWNHWACWCQCHLHMPAELPLSLLLNYFHASDHLKRRKDSKTIQN